jgi:murein L,D-transpeptidase YcbB/YkuD
LLHGRWIDESDGVEVSALVPQQNIQPQKNSLNKTKEVSWTSKFSSKETRRQVTSSHFKGLISGKSYAKQPTNKLYSHSSVKRFYKNRGNNYFWFKDSFSISPQIRDLIKAINRAPNETLDNLKRYHKDEIDALIDQIETMPYEDNQKELVFKTLDILLTDAFLTLANDLAHGRADYTKLQKYIQSKSKETEINYKWSTPKNKRDFNSLLLTLYATSNIEQGLYNLLNNNLIYKKLKKAYFKYKKIVDNGGWKSIPRGKIIEYGNRGNRVNALAYRLFLSGDFPSYRKNYTKFDKPLKKALQSYQKRMGLWESGKLTPKTRRSLNVSARAKLELIKLNIDKSKWENNNMNGKFIFVNIPDFMMRFYNGDSIILKSRVIVGTRKNPTPIFSSSMSYIVLNPTWTVPNSIIVDEMLEKLKKNPGYLKSEEFDIYNGWGRDRLSIDPHSVDWSKYTTKSKIPYAFVRKPGKGNPLGKIKFMFPNDNAVYMHDTPSKHLFKKRVRAYSHGCIRLHNPYNLLKVLSDDYISKSYNNLKNYLQKDDIKSVGLKSKIPIYIRYYTVFVNNDGSIRFASDIYGYDKTLLKIRS